MSGLPDSWSRQVALRQRIALGVEAELAAAYREGRTLPFDKVAELSRTLLEEVAGTLPHPVVAPAGAPLTLERNALTASEREVPPPAGGVL